LTWGLPERAQRDRAKGFDWDSQSGPVNQGKAKFTATIVYVEVIVGYTNHDSSLGFAYKYQLPRFKLNAG
jgi:hypothetical protein